MKVNEKDKKDVLKEICEVYIVMAADAVKMTHVGLRGPSSVSLGTPHSTDPSLHVNQLQFNLRAPYSINSLASNFKTPQPLVIEKFPVFPNEHPEVHHRASIPSSPASSVSSERLHFAVQLAKIDAKKLWRQQKESEMPENVKEVKSEVKQDKRNLKTTEVKGTKKMTQDRKRHNIGYIQYKRKNDHDVRRNLHDVHQFIPDSEDNEADSRPSVGSDEKQTREIRRLEKQIQNYLQRLDDLIHKGHEVVQKKDKRLHVRRNDKDDISHLSDEDTDPRQYERAEEQATRSARVLYMIEQQIRELDDEIRKKGKNMKQSKKSETLGRLAAAQRATVRALRMLINSAPLQPKRSQHYPSIYQALTSLIQQLSSLAIQIEDGDVEFGRKPQVAGFDDPLKRRSNANSRPITQKKTFAPAKTEARPLISGNKHAFFHEAERDVHDTRYPRSKHQPSMQGNFPDDSTLTVDPTPERNATLKAGLEALLRVKELERKSAKPVTKEIMLNQANTKKKAVLLPPALQAKRRKAHIAVQKSVKFPSETAHFTKETTASRLKKVERQKAKQEMKYQKTEGNVEPPGETETRTGADRSGEAKMKPGHETDHKLPEREIERQLWLEDQSRKKLQEVMDIPKNLISDAENAIKKKLRPLLDQAQAMVNSSKTKPVQERFANIASEVTMKENEVLSEMILNDLLIDTAQEFQRLERNEEVDDETSFLQNNSTLENILQRLENFEEEEESMRRHLNQFSYVDLYETKQRPRNIRQNYKDERETISTKDPNEPTLGVRPSSLNYTRTSTVFNPVDKHPVSLFLPSKVRENIFSYREKYSEYLEQTSAEHHGTFDPWQLVERLSDEILEEMVSEVASEFTGACDDVTEMLFKSEFMKE